VRHYCSSAPLRMILTAALARLQPTYHWNATVHAQTGACGCASQSSASHAAPSTRVRWRLRHSKQRQECHLVRSRAKLPPRFPRQSTVPSSPCKVMIGQIADGVQPGRSDDRLRGRTSPPLAYCPPARAGISTAVSSGCACRMTQYRAAADCLATDAQSWHRASGSGWPSQATS
jgi:hypothetical protein